MVMHKGGRDRRFEAGKKAKETLSKKRKKLGVMVYSCNLSCTEPEIGNRKIVVEAGHCKKEKEFIKNKLNELGASGY
jgi:hypothetical protein